MPEAKIVRPMPGDIVVWRVDDDFKGDLGAVAEDIQRMFPNNQVIVTNDADVSVWTDDDLAGMGLQRIKQT